MAPGIKGLPHYLPGEGERSIHSPPVSVSLKTQVSRRSVPPSPSPPKRTTIPLVELWAMAALTLGAGDYSVRTLGQVLPIILKSRIAAAAISSKTKQVAAC